MTLSSFCIVTNSWYLHVPCISSLNFRRARHLMLDIQTLLPHSKSGICIWSLWFYDKFLYILLLMINLCSGACMLTTDQSAQRTWLLLHLYSSKSLQPWFNSLTPMNDQHLISPYNITPESNIMVTRIKEMITN